MEIEVSTILKIERGRTPKNTSYMELANNGSLWMNIRDQKRIVSFEFEKTLCISLDCRLDPVQYREYKNAVFVNIILNFLASCERYNQFCVISLKHWLPFSTSRWIWMKNVMKTLVSSENDKYKLTD